MIKINISTIEKAFGKQVIKNIVCLGVDTASRTGWCKATVNGSYIIFEYGFIDIESKDITFKYNRYIDFFKQYFENQKIDKVIIEEAYYGRNVKSFQKLSRFGMIVYMAAYLKDINRKFLPPSESRKSIGLIKMGNKPKEEVHKALKSKIDLGIEDVDIIDSFILCFTGILQENSLI